MTQIEPGREWLQAAARDILARKAAAIRAEPAPDPLQAQLDGAVVLCDDRRLVHLGLALTTLMALALKGRSDEALIALVCIDDRDHPRPSNFDVEAN